MFPSQIEFRHFSLVSRCCNCAMCGEDPDEDEDLPPPKWQRDIPQAARGGGRRDSYDQPMARSGGGQRRYQR